MVYMSSDKLSINDCMLYKFEKDSPTTNRNFGFNQVEEKNQNATLWKLSEIFNIHKTISKSRIKMLGFNRI